MWYDIALVLGAYLLGSAPHLSGLARLCGMSLDGDLHINLWRRAGPLVGLVGILGEFVKGVTPVLVGKGLGFDLLVVTLAGLAAVVGQMWPVFRRFDGEKGNSIGVAMAAALAPITLCIALVPLAIGVVVKTLPGLLDSRQSLNERFKFGGPPSRSLPLAMAIAFFVLPIASYLLGEPLVITSGFAVLFVLMIGVRRLTAGLRDDLPARTSIGSILLNRFLYDRSYR